MEKLKIRKATKEDINQICEVAKQLWDTEKVFFDNIQDSYYEKEAAQKDIQKCIMNKKGIFLVAEKDNQIIAFIEGHIIDDLDSYKEKISYINRLVVDENYRKKGIGQLLIDEYGKRSKKRGCKYLKLNAFENNTPAVKLYKNIGFKEYSIMYMKKID